MWHAHHPSGTQATPLPRKLARPVVTLVQWVRSVPLWVWALLLGIASLVAALVFATAGGGFGDMPGRRPFARCSVVAIVLGLISAAKDPDEWRAGITASVIGGLAMVAWSILRVLLGGPLGQ